MFLFYMNIYQCGQVRAGDHENVNKRIDNTSKLHHD